ncbi:Uncharacterised protein [uncultured archaeon]|nr:Uncharacterised protein [uncultured archaeon]
MTLHALRFAKDKALIIKYRTFLQREIDAFACIVLEDGKVRNADFSGMRDYAVRSSSCYDHCMAILLAREAKKLGFKFAYSEKELVKTLGSYWIGYYRDDMASLAPSGDANALPYWLGVGKDFNKTLSILQDELPLSYGARQKMIAEEFFVPDWETSAVWPLLGFIWMKAVKKYKPALAKEYKHAYAELIEKYDTLYEVYTNRKPYKSFFYHADEGMLWAANFLAL